MPKRKSYGAYVKLYRRCVALIIIAVMTMLFYVLWDQKLNGLMDRKFLGKGNWLVLFYYAVITYVFMHLWGGFKLGYQKIANVIASQILAAVSVNFMVYIQVVLMIGTINELWITAQQMVGLAIEEIVACLAISILFMNIYTRLFPAHRILQINGDHENHLRMKMKSRDDKYQICEEISIHEPHDVILDKIAGYDTVLLNDIPSVHKNKILKYCFDHSIRVYFTPKISDILVTGTEVIDLFDSPLLLCKNIGLGFEQKVCKRIVDVIVSLLGLLIASPVMIVTAVCIKCEDGGPVFFRQDRCTLNGRVFSICKFRSMVVGAEKDGKPRPATDHDDRITKVGNIIRRTRIDELPQLFNILKGEMSLIGPRPERIEHIERYEREIPEFAYRLKMKGGLTGYAQVYGRYNTTAYDKLKMDLLYIVNYSVLLDLQILFETIKILFKKDSTEGFTQQQVKKVQSSQAVKKDG